MLLSSINLLSLLLLASKYPKFIPCGSFPVPKLTTDSYQIKTTSIFCASYCVANHESTLYLLNQNAFVKMKVSLVSGKQYIMANPFFLYHQESDFLYFSLFFFFFLMFYFCIYRIKYVGLLPLLYII